MWWYCRRRWGRRTGSNRKRAAPTGRPFPACPVLSSRRDADLQILPEARPLGISGSTGAGLQGQEQSDLGPAGEREVMGVIRGVQRMRYFVGRVGTVVLEFAAAIIGAGSA